MAVDKKTLPTDFAMSLMEKCDFLEEKKSGCDLVKRTKMEEIIANFQRMSICSSFEESLVSFHGIELTGEQMDVLQVIYKSTKPWLMGLTIDACITAITYSHMAKNEFAEAVKTLLEQLKNQEPEKIGKRMQGIIVKISKPE